MPLITNIEKTMEQRFINKIQREVERVKYYSNIARVYKSSAGRIIQVIAKGSLSHMSASDYERYEELLENSEQAKALCHWHMTKLEKIVFKYCKGKLLVCSITTHPEELRQKALKAVKDLGNIEIAQ